MTPVAIWLLALGLTDLIASPSGTPPTSRRASLASATGGIVIGFAMLGSDTGLDRWTAAIIIAAGLGLLGTWTHGRRYATSTRPAGILLAGLGATTLLVAATAELWPESDGGAIHRWFERLPYGMIQNSPDQAAIAAAVIVMLVATGNAIVRLVLETSKSTSEVRKAPSRNFAVVA